ncbi:hypothetical protein P7D22_10980 [Lichenihabitans sp. Uapishka_5]|uniref:hypothetical protein n=1 Tax=Lichenihabitans sp. Uapishka_5 TaxID=3037302 RepID=UPI0029E7FA57|nr:hypothetical protein [Lichenihabitans sp. Uapishka_5]MDX7951691.1 hypothetical protein [Lichenihabitans sp. Uapishka_5]
MTLPLALRATVSGSLGSLTSTAALMVLAEAAGKSAWQPTNATSHWRHGPIAAAVRQADTAHTGVGYATHHAATVFWALGYEWWAGSRVRLTPAAAFGGALAVSALAAVVDYGATPKRFTPGWEFVLSRRAMAGAYLAMAAGLAAGALLVRRQA